MFYFSFFVVVVVVIGGGNMRGDQKWPPENYAKRQSDIDNEQRRQLALGPATRPRRVNKVI